MSVKRYSGERDSLFDVEYVLATDFDALAKRLEEAERLLSAVCGHNDVLMCTACCPAIDAFLENRL